MTKTEAMAQQAEAWARMLESLKTVEPDYNAIHRNIDAMAQQGMATRNIEAEV